MASRKRSSVPKPTARPTAAREAVLRRRVSACERAKRAGEGTMIAAGLLALVVFPLLSISPSAPSVWSVRGLAVGGFLLVAAAMFFDQHYRGELVSQEKGRDVRDEVFRASLCVVAAAALLPILIVSFYP